MKKMIFTTLVLVSLLAVLTGTVSAAPNAGGVIALVQVRNDANGNVIFVFNVSGDYAKHKMNGSVHVPGSDGVYGLHCSLTSPDTIQCTTSRKTGGQNVIVYLEGFVFWTRVPAASTPISSGSTQICYGVYDIFIDFSSESAYWQESDTHCQDEPANVGDTLELGESSYEFDTESPVCWIPPVSNEGYFAQCPL